MPYNPARANPAYVPDAGRYGDMRYRRVGASGIELPVISLGLWQNFGDDRPLAGMRAILRRAFDLGITHFDLANNYGPPYGAAETNFGRIYGEDLAPYRNELIISTKAGYDQWPGPYGDLGSRKYLLSSLDQSLARMRLDYVDIFYHHRPDPVTPLEETMGALDAAVRQGKAVYVGVSNYPAERTEQAIEILRRLGTPLLIHQPRYSMLDRWIEAGLLDVLGRHGVGSIVFSPLAQGLLTDRYLDGMPADSRVRIGEMLDAGALSDENPRPGARAQRDRARPRPIAGPARDRLGPARRARDLSADRREQRGAARAERRRARQPRAQRRRAEPDRDSARSLKGGPGRSPEAQAPDVVRLSGRCARASRRLRAGAPHSSPRRARHGRLRAPRRRR
jgi:L-glyceraldehyde 3-phosphate reductase